MKITKRQLKRIIKEELQEMHAFDPTQEMGAQGLSRDETLYYEPSDFQIPGDWGWENAPGEWSMSTARGYKEQGQPPQPGTYVVENNVIAAVDSDAKVWVFAKKNAREALQSLKDAGFTEANPRFTVPVAAMGLR